MDVDGAFNKTNLQGVVKAMRDRNFPDIFTNWYEALVDTGMTSCTRRLTLGVPNGDPLRVLWHGMSISNPF